MKEDNWLKQTRKDLHEMHKANVRQQTELDKWLKELREKELLKEVEELKRQAQEVDKELKELQKNPEQTEPKVWLAGMRPGERQRQDSMQSSSSMA